ncbi:F0F1 ATP synthase subunit gamma, partial [Fischerella thermalis WC249]
MGNGKNFYPITNYQLPITNYQFIKIMANLKAIRDRIQSVKNTKKITEAMRLVAAARVRRAQEQVLAT